MSRYLPTTHTFAKAEVQRLQRLPGTVDRNKGLQLLTPRDEHYPRPPDSARNADGSGGSGAARGGDLSFRRPLQSARARLETVPRDIAQAAADMGKSHMIKAAGGRADHPSVRQNDPTLRGLATENTGKGYCKPSLTETQWGVDVAAEELNNPSHFRSSAALRKTLAHDGRRTRFSRRHRTFSDIQRHDHFNQLVEESKTPADGRAIRLEREVWDPRLSDVQRALARLMPTSISVFPVCAPALRVLFAKSSHMAWRANSVCTDSYELQQVQKHAQQSETLHHAATPLSSVRRTAGGRDNTTETEDVVEHLFKTVEKRNLDKALLQQEILQKQRAAAEKAETIRLHKLAIVKTLSNTHGVHLESKLHQMAGRARMPEVQNITEPLSHSDEQAKKERAARLKMYLDGVELLHQGDQAVPDKDKIHKIGLTGRHEVHAIAHVALTGMQSRMLESSLIRSAENQQRRLQAAEEREQQEMASLFRLKISQKDDMAAEALRKERAEERRIERERQTNPKTVAEDEHIDFVKDVRQVSHCSFLFLRVVVCVPTLC